MQIALLHTAQIHVESFTRIFKDLDPSLALTQHVREDLLARARRDGIDAVSEDTRAELAELSKADAVICTCSTLGPIAAAFAGNHVFRIDLPLMEQACRTGPRILVGICLESTRHATLDLLNSVADGSNTSVTPEILLCDRAWPYFESGDQAGFAKSIADQITAKTQSTQYDCVLLAQASMRVAEPLLCGLDIPVMSSPELAAKHALHLARNKG